MKICPICQQNFPNGFQYCPNDTELLLTQEDFQRLSPPAPAPPVPTLASSEHANSELLNNTLLVF